MAPDTEKPGRPVAVVTGATRGIGRAIALELARQGHDVAFNYARSADAARTLEAELSDLGAASLGVQADVARFDEVKGFFEQVLDRFGTLNVLVNNAGITRDRYLMRMSPEEWREVLDTNLTGTFHCCRAAVVTLMKQRGGTIINISSTGGIIGMAGQVNYAASKAGQIGLTLALAKEVARYGVRVNAVAPGYIETEMTGELGTIGAEVLRQIPLGKLGAPEDVAKAVAFLASDASRYITGQVLVVDGGFTIQGGHVVEGR